MKPTPQISSRPRPSSGDHRTSIDSKGLPLTDYNFQPVVEAVVTSRSTTGTRFIKLDTFRKTSSDFLNTEMVRDYFAELTLFAVIVAASAWSLIAMGIWIARVAR
jgi:hypothetical protein